MNTENRASTDHQRRVPVARLAYGIGLLIVVAALLIFSLRYAFPSGNTGIEQDPEESGAPK